MCFSHVGEEVVPVHDRRHSLVKMFRRSSLSQSSSFLLARNLRCIFSVCSAGVDSVRLQSDGCLKRHMLAILSDRSVSDRKTQPRTPRRKTLSDVLDIARCEHRSTVAANRHEGRSESRIAVDRSSCRVYQQDAINRCFEVRVLLDSA